MSDDLCARCGNVVTTEEAHAHGLDYFHPECCPQCAGTWGVRDVSDRGLIVAACIAVLILCALMAPTLMRGPAPVAERIEAAP
jgi:hypothetical protein